MVTVIYTHYDLAMYLVYLNGKTAHAQCHKQQPAVTNNTPLSSKARSHYRTLEFKDKFVEKREYLVD